MFRDTPHAFSCDSLALILAQEAIAIGADKALSAIECSFIYIPFMHSESLLIHDQAVPHYTHNGIEAHLNFELQHKKSFNNLVVTRTEIRYHAVIISRLKSPF